MAAQANYMTTGCSAWRDDDYRRMVMACLIEAVYLLELERQERRDAAAVAQQWWKPFRYRLVHELVDERDGSVFGAIFEREHQAAPPAARFGSENVCLCGHSLGAGFARQVARMLASSSPRHHQQPAAAAASLEFHLFNAPYLSLPMGVRSVVKTADCLLKAVRTGVAAVGRWHGKALKNVAYANCILGYTRLESSRRL
uniref:Fungal lipase-like domain-containing protein n=1 Tax=Oryza brachyantha TaxID=4533 RepID=J3MMH8_ORYBR